MSRFCQSCQYKNLNKAIYCANCGTRLEIDNKSFKKIIFILMGITLFMWIVFGLLKSHEIQRINNQKRISKKERDNFKICMNSSYTYSWLTSEQAIEVK